MPTTTETYHYRVKDYAISSLTGKLVERSDNLRKEKPSAGRGVPASAKITENGNKTTWQWKDVRGKLRKVVAVKLEKPVTKTFEYDDLW